jgi:23S rRNA (uracil1939-C5)-methyltransferase
MADRRRPGGGPPGGRGRGPAPRRGPGETRRAAPEPQVRREPATTADEPIETPPPVADGEVLRLRVQSMAYGGEAVGRSEEGAVVFVWGAMPGEEVEVEITDRRKRYLRGRVRAVLAPSPDRVEPPCPIFGICGGCQWQYMAYPAQVAAKQQILLEQVRGAFPEAAARLRPPVAMADPWHYRNVAHFVGDTEGRPGFRGWQSHAVVPVPFCPITQEPINAQLGQYQGDLYPDERLSLRCTAAGDQLQGWRGDGAAMAERVITERVLDHVYQVSPRAFFQVNTRLERRAPLSGPADGQEDPSAAPTSLTEDLVRLVLEGVEGYTHQAVVDAYSGGGLFALPLAARAPRVIGIEESGESVQDAMASAANAGLTNTVFLQGAAATLLPAVAEPVSAVVLDPPRTGVEEAALHALIGKGVPRIVYVSCNPPTLGRDLRVLAAGGYQLDWLRLVDLFPQTLHIEAVAVLTLR